MSDGAKKPIPGVTWLRPEDASGDYTDEMRQRALARIAKRREKQDVELLRSQYMHAMFGLFTRRLSRLSVDAGVAGADGEKGKLPVKPE